jgi:hypothetical protein
MAYSHQGQPSAALGNALDTSRVNRVACKVNP